MSKDRSLAQSQNLGSIVCIAKTAKPTMFQDYGPITLPKTICRIFARFITKRMRPTLTSLCQYICTRTHRIGCHCRISCRKEIWKSRDCVFCLLILLPPSTKFHMMPVTSLAAIRIRWKFHQDYFLSVWLGIFEGPGEWAPIIGVSYTALTSTRMLIEYDPFTLALNLLIVLLDKTLKGIYIGLRGTKCTCGIYGRRGRHP